MHVVREGHNTDRSLFWRWGKRRKLREFRVRSHGSGFLTLAFVDNSDIMKKLFIIIKMINKIRKLDKHKFTSGYVLDNYIHF